MYDELFILIGRHATDVTVFTVRLDCSVHRFSGDCQTFRVKVLRSYSVLRLRLARRTDRLQRMILSETTVYGENARSVRLFRMHVAHFRRSVCHARWRRPPSLIAFRALDGVGGVFPFIRCLTYRTRGIDGGKKAERGREKADNNGATDTVISGCYQPSSPPRARAPGYFRARKIQWRPAAFRWPSFLSSIFPDKLVIYRFRQKKKTTIPSSLICKSTP